MNNMIYKSKNITETEFCYVLILDGYRYGEVAKDKLAKFALTNGYKYVLEALVEYFKKLDPDKFKKEEIKSENDTNKFIKLSIEGKTQEFLHCLYANYKDIYLQILNDINR